jgi:vitamin B12 transporter
MKRAFFVLALILPLFAKPASSEETRQLEKIIVTPSRIQSSSANSGRSVTVLDAETMQMSAYDAIQDMTGNLGCIDIRRRGPEGVQSDVNIRGATFEQNTVLIDGIKINDPQTGHHTMDLPLTAFDMERVEILKGPASSLYGANSFGGVINLITKPPEDKKFIVEAIGGQRDYFSGGASLSYPVGPVKNRFSIDWNRARPYIPNTEFDIINMTDSAMINTDFGVYDFLFGYSFKDFGADSFYSNLYPNEAETTDTRFFKLGTKIEYGSLRIEPKIYLRRHYDKFILDKNRAGWQTNYHTNYTYGSDLGFVIENQFMDVAYGFELAEDRIFSTSLQKHDRGRTGLYLEISPHIHDKLYINVGIRQDTFSDFSTEYSPSVNLKYDIFNFLDIRSSIGRSYRIPTFTDLYYRDAANIGNADLKTENSWTYEAALDYKGSIVNCSIGYFNRNSSETIDWTRVNSSDPWRASNIGSVEVNGVESSIEITPQKVKKDFPISKLFVNYTGLDEYDKHDYLSKYALDYLKQEICGGLEYNLFGFTNSWIVNYKKRVSSPGSALVVDTKLTKNIISKKNVAFKLFLEITNLFDADYSEQSGIPMPGRWLKSGARLEF